MLHHTFTWVFGIVVVFCGIQFLAWLSWVAVKRIVGFLMRP